MAFASRKPNRCFAVKIDDGLESMPIVIVQPLYFGLLLSGLKNTHLYA